MGRRPLPEGSRKAHPRKQYIEVKRSGHPLARNGWVAEHREVLFNEIGPWRHLCHWCGGEVVWGRNLHVDHLDHDRQNNAAENLVPACAACNSRRWKSSSANGVGEGVEK